MLAEFALTPEIFDEQAHPDRDAWWEQLRELGSGIFPRSTPCATVISDLYDGSWRHVAAELASAISDDRARRLCEGLLQKIADCLVHRPASKNAVWPEDEMAWAREAIASYSIEPIDRIITSATTCAAVAAGCDAVRSITEVTGSGFWRGPWEETSPPMRIDAQLACIRKICVHADFVCLISPEIYGGDGDETDFAVELIRCCHRRPAGFHPVDIEIHTETFLPNAAHPEFAEKLTKRVASVSNAIRQELLKGQKARVVVWPKLLDRVLIAGTKGDAQNQRRPRWGISMNHIARRSDEKRTDFYTEWKVLAPNSLGRWFDQYCKDSSSKSLREAVVEG